MKWFLLALLILALGIGIGLTARAALERRAARRESAAASSRAAEASERAETGEENRPEKTETPFDEETSANSTEAGTAVPPETAPVLTEPEESTAAFRIRTAEELLPVPDSLGRTLLSEGGWYGGKFVRDLTTGEVKCEWDRSAELTGMLERYGGIYHKNSDQKVCYLTFDCGGTSTAEDVREVLAILKEKNVKAIFFVPGEFFLNSPRRENESLRADRAAVLKEILEQGHLIGNHTYTHPNMDELSDGEFIEQLNGMQLKLNEALGFDVQLSYYRPPSGHFSERDLYLAQQMGYAVTLWSFAYMDYDANNQLPVTEALNKAETGLHDGCVYLLHAMSSANRAMLGDLIDYIKGEGYELRRIDR